MSAGYDLIGLFGNVVRAAAPYLPDLEMLKNVEMFQTFSTCGSISGLFCSVIKIEFKKMSVLSRWSSGTGISIFNDTVN